jgi:hypothetical protein
MHIRNIIHDINTYYILKNLKLKQYNNLVINYKIKSQNKSKNDILNIKFK